MEVAGGLLRRSPDESSWCFAPGTVDNPTLTEADVDFAAGKLAAAVRRALVDDLVEADLTEHIADLPWFDPASTKGLFATIFEQKQLLDAHGCAALRAAVDAQVDRTCDTTDCFAQHHLTITLGTLRELLGSDAVDRLAQLPQQMLRQRWTRAHRRAQDIAARPPHEREHLEGALQEARASASAMTKLSDGLTVNTYIRRYSRTTRPWLYFHTDRSTATVNVALTSDDSFEGGRLHAIIEGDHKVVGPRGEGDVTCHGDDVMHAVSCMRSGVRYSLVMLFFAQGDQQTAAAESLRPERVRA